MKAWAAAVGFAVFSVLWVAGNLWHGYGQKRAVGVAVLFSPLFWVLAAIVALGSVYLARR